MSDGLGKDIAWDQQLLLTPAGDYATTEGVDNLRSSIYRRLLTHPGSYRHRPEYGAGLARYVKRAASSSMIDEMTAKIREQCLRDKRIAAVVAVTVVSDEGVVTVSLTIQTSTGQTLALAPMRFTEMT